MPDSLDSASTASESEEGGGVGAPRNCTTSCCSTSTSTEVVSLYTPPLSSAVDPHCGLFVGDPLSPSLASPDGAYTEYIVVTTTMSCTTSNATTMHGSSKHARDLNNRWVLLNKDTFQEILNDALNRMTASTLDDEGESPVASPRDTDSPADRAKAASPGPDGSARSSATSSADKLESSDNTAVDTVSKLNGNGQAHRTEEPPHVSSHSNVDNISDSATPSTTGSVTGVKTVPVVRSGRGPQASTPTRTIIATSAFKKQQLKVVSRIAALKDGGAAGGGAGGSKSADKKPSVVTNVKTTRSTGGNSSGHQRKQSASGSRRSKTASASASAVGNKVSAAGKIAPGDPPTVDSALEGGSSRAHIGERSSPVLPVAAATATAHSVGQPVSAKAAEANRAQQQQQSVVVSAPQHLRRATATDKPAPESPPTEDQTPSSSQQDEPVNMSVAAVTGSPSTESPGTSSPRSTSPPASQRAVVQGPQAERWVKVSKSTLYEMVEELVARRLGEDSPVPGDNNDRNKDNSNQRIELPAPCTSNAPARIPGTRNIVDAHSESLLAHTANNNSTNTGGNHNRLAGHSVQGPNVTRNNRLSSDSSSNCESASPADRGLCKWVALNKKVVIGLVDEAIMRGLQEGDENDNDAAADEAGHENEDEDVDVVSDAGVLNRNVGNIQPVEKASDVGDKNGTVNTERVALRTSFREKSGVQQEGSFQSVAIVTSQSPQATRSSELGSYSPPLIPSTSLSQPYPAYQGLMSSSGAHGVPVRSQGKKRGASEWSSSMDAESGRTVHVAGGGLPSGMKRRRSDSGSYLVDERVTVLSKKDKDSVVTPNLVPVHAHGQTGSSVATHSRSGTVAVCTLFPADPHFVSPSGDGVQPRASPFVLDHSPAKTPLASRQCNSINPAVATRRMGRRSAANQPVPADLANNDVIAGKLDGHTLDPRSRKSAVVEGNRHLASGIVDSGAQLNERDKKGTRDSPETTWVAVSKVDVNNIVDCVVNTMISDDVTVTSPAISSDVISVTSPASLTNDVAVMLSTHDSSTSRSSRATSITSLDDDRCQGDSDDDIPAENVPPPPPLDLRTTSAQESPGSNSSVFLCGDADLLPLGAYGRMPLPPPQRVRSQSLASDPAISSQLEKPLFSSSSSSSSSSYHSGSPASKAKEKAFDYSMDSLLQHHHHHQQRPESGSDVSSPPEDEEGDEECDGGHCTSSSSRGFNWKKSLMRRAREETTADIPQGSPLSSLSGSRSCCNSEPSKSDLASIPTKQNQRRSSKRATRGSTSGEKRRNPRLTPLTAK